MDAAKNWRTEFDALDDLAMEYEVAVIPFFKTDYLQEFYDFYEIKRRDAKLTPLQASFEEALREVSGEHRWEAIAKKAKELFGLPSRVMVFDDVKHLKGELEGPMGLAPFFFVFDMMFCEYEGFTLCFMSGTNN
ncbi:MAG: hypothetical protein Q4D27_01360 [Coriobacteriia bacterium]|nr:hypothetical protein [Coriobacteriia bacterium]